MAHSLILLAASMLFQATESPAPVDPTGFVAALNDARAARGLAAVAYDASAAGTAHRNNLAQRIHGLGHHVLDSFGQCAAVGFSGAHAALAAWSGSPSHAAIIYAPNLVSCGFDEIGGCCTVATSQGGYAAPVQAQAQAQAPAYYGQPQMRCYPRRWRRGWRW